MSLFLNIQVWIVITYKQRFLGALIIFKSMKILGTKKFENHFLFFFFKDFIYLFLERGREGERAGEKHQCAIASHKPLTGDLAQNPGMCPDWESNQRPFGS